MSKTLEQAARELGEKGAPASEDERLLFEAWMFGHCWEVTGMWNGTTYVCASESTGYCDPDAMRTRQLWAAWRDRAALSAETVSVPIEALALERYRPIKTTYWWRVAIGDGQQTIGRCYSETEAQKLAAALCTAFLDGAFLAAHDKERNDGC